jgi:hypothetical protein
MSEIKMVHLLFNIDTQGKLVRLHIAPPPSGASWRYLNWAGSVYQGISPLVSGK